MLRWARSKARLVLDHLLSSSSSGVQRVGNEHSGWVIDTNFTPTVAYCAGVGKGITFELELAKFTAHPVLVFDPSPTGINTIAAIPPGELSNIRFLPVGLAAHTGQIQFSVPKDPNEGSFSIVQDGIEVVSFACENLAAIMRQNGDSYIDILKMDIEGFEYDIVHQFLDQQIPIRQLCVEFHPWLRPGQTLKTIQRLRRAGYRIIYKHYGDFTFVLRDSRFQQLRQSSAALEAQKSSSPADRASPAAPSSS